MKSFIILACFIAGVCITDAYIFRALRGMREEVQTGANLRQCFRKILMCANLVKNVPIVLPEVNENGMTITEETLSSLCSAGAQFVPCLTTLMLPGEQCEIISRIQNKYNFICLTNRSDILDLFMCANKKLVQTKAFGCSTFLYGSYFSMYEHFKREKKQGPLKQADVYRWLCSVLKSTKSCLKWSVLPECKEKDATTLMSFFNDDTINTWINLVPKITHMEDNTRSFNISTCPSYY